MVVFCTSGHTTWWHVLALKHHDELDLWRQWLNTEQAQRHWVVVNSAWMKSCFEIYRKQNVGLAQIWNVNLNRTYVTTDQTNIRCEHWLNNIVRYTNMWNLVLKPLLFFLRCLFLKNNFFFSLFLQVVEPLFIVWERRSTRTKNKYGGSKGRFIFGKW